MKWYDNELGWREKNKNESRDILISFVMGNILILAVIIWIVWFIDVLMISF